MLSILPVNQYSSENWVFHGLDKNLCAMIYLFIYLFACVCVHVCVFFLLFTLVAAS